MNRLSRRSILVFLGLAPVALALPAVRAPAPTRLRNYRCIDAWGEPYDPLKISDGFPSCSRLNKGPLP